MNALRIVTNTIKQIYERPTKEIIRVIFVILDIKNSFDSNELKNIIDNVKNMNELTNHIIKRPEIYFSNRKCLIRTKEEKDFLIRI